DGSGPAGAATALRLAAAPPELAAGTVLLDKARHPRDKTCAGGVIPKALRLLEELGVPFAVPHARVDSAAVAVPGRRVAVAGSDLCRVVRRREFDARLARAARERGVELREGERVVGLSRDGAGIRVETDHRAYWAPVVVGAEPAGWKAFPIRTHAPGTRVAAPHALLVGDAAGCDPLMGEGISFALEYGMLAADAIVVAHASGDWSFRGYARAVERGVLGRKLRRLYLGARLFYGPRQRLWFRVA